MCSQPKSMQVLKDHCPLIIPGTELHTHISPCRVGVHWLPAIRQYCPDIRRVRGIRMSAYSRDVSNEEVMASQFCADLAAAGLRVAVHPTAPDQTAQSA